MQGDWKVGDEAQCVKRGYWFRDNVPGPTFMQLYTVVKVVRYKKAKPKEMGLALGFAEFPGLVYCHTCFRKPQPLKADPVERVQMRESVHG